MKKKSFPEILSQKTHPILFALLQSKVVKVEGSEYVGLASDRVWVNIGLCGEETNCEDYLKDHPTPDKW